MNQTPAMLKQERKKIIGKLIQYCGATLALPAVLVLGVSLAERFNPQAEQQAESTRHRVALNEDVTSYDMKAMSMHDLSGPMAGLGGGMLGVSALLVAGPPAARAVRKRKMKAMFRR